MRRQLRRLLSQLLPRARLRSELVYCPPSSFKRHDLHLSLKYSTIFEQSDDDLIAIAALLVG